MRYLVKCKLNPNKKDRLTEDIKSGTLARGKVFYEGMQAALREATIDENNVVQFIEICYCLEGGLYPMAMEIPVLSQYFENVAEVKDARFRDQCTMECEFCDCTRSIKLPGKQLMNELSIAKEKVNHNADFTDIGRIKLNRKKQKEGIKGLKILHNNNNDRNLKPIFAGAAISGLFAIFYDGVDYFRVKNIPDNDESRLILRGLGLDLYGSVNSMKSTARDSSLASNNTRSNVV